MLVCIATPCSSLEVEGMEAAYIIYTQGNFLNTNHSMISLGHAEKLKEKNESYHITVIDVGLTSVCNGTAKEI